MGEITEKIKPLIMILVIITLFNTIPFCVFAFDNRTHNYSEDIGTAEISMNDRNVSTIISGVGIFVPFVSLLSINVLDYPFNMLLGLIIVILSALQIFLYVAIALNMLPFFNT
jgi:hypothetical protein